MKKEYMKPAMRVVQVQQKFHLLEGSKVLETSVTGAYQMSRQGDDWEDDWDDEED